MRTIQRFSTLIMALFLLLGTAYAMTVTYRFSSGTCENGNGWWSETAYDEGRPTQVTGQDCDGNSYQRTPTYVAVHTDPTRGEKPIEIGKNWYAVVRYDASQRVTWIGGQDANGEFYEANLE